MKVIAHTVKTTLELQIAFFHPHHDSWFLNKSQSYIRENRSAHRPRVLLVNMAYAGCEGDVLVMKPTSDVVFSFTRDTAWFRLDEHGFNEQISVDDLVRAHLQNPHKGQFSVQKATEHDRFLIELLVSCHGDRLFTVHDITVKGLKKTCRFIEGEEEDEEEEENDEELFELSD